MVKTHFLLENLCISESSLGILEKSQRSLVLPNIKYNCVVLFLSQLYWLFIYASKYFSHRLPLYNVFNKAELYVLHAPCTSNKNREMVTMTSQIICKAMMTINHPA